MIEKGYAELRGWEVGDEQRARMKGICQKPKTRPLGLGFSQLWIWVGGTWLRRDTPGLRAGKWGTSSVQGWGELGQKPKTEPLGLGFG